MIYVSSAAIGEGLPAGSKNDKTPPHHAPLAELAAAHASAERQILAECRAGGVAAYAVRTPLVYGPRCPLIADIATELRDEKAWLIGKGEGVFNGVYVDNLIAALRLCLKTKLPAGESFVVSDAETVTWRELYEAIARELDLAASRIRSVDSAHTVAEDPRLMTGGIHRPAVTLRAAFQESTTKPPLSSATKSLGYTPVVSFTEGIRLSCAWWRFAQGDFRVAA
jgi:nucleoside-diphosphate-sugar epimerase